MEILAAETLMQGFTVPISVRQGKQDAFSHQRSNDAQTAYDSSDRSNLAPKTDPVVEPLANSGRRISTLSFDPSKICKGFFRKEDPGTSTSISDLIKTEEGSEIVCSLCNDSFPSFASLQAHMKVHAVAGEHTYSDENTTDIKIDAFKFVEDRSIKCSICDRRFFTKANLRGHMRVHSGETPFSCVYCDKRFAHGKNLHRHIRIAHKGEISNAASLCTKLFRASNSSENRLISYTGEGLKPYKCAVCAKTFRRLYRVKEHTRSHSGQKPFQCSVCSKLFSSSDILYRHVKRLHNGGVPLLSSAQSKIPKVEAPDAENPPVIEVSPLNMQMQHDLNQVNFLNIARNAEIIDVARMGETTYNNHTYYIDVRSDFGDQLQAAQEIPQVHQLPQGQQEAQTAEKAFQCSLCGSAFDSSTLLNKHIATHKIYVPWKCSVCMKEFRTESYLKRHMTIHSGEKPYKCSLCPKAFGRQYSLRNHWRSHTGEKPYQCSVCCKSFAVSDNMYRHIKKMHNGEGLQSAIGLVKQIQDKNRELRYSDNSKNQV